MTAELVNTHPPVFAELSPEIVSPTESNAASTPGPSTFAFSVAGTEAFANVSREPCLRYRLLQPSTAATFASVYFFGNLAKAFRYCVSPFDANVIDAMRKFAYSLIPWVVLDSVTATAASGLGGSLGNSVNININLGMLFMVLVVFGLCYVFRYGAVLQQESDETL